MVDVHSLVLKFTLSRSHVHILLSEHSPHQMHYLLLRLHLQEEQMGLMPRVRQGRQVRKRPTNAGFSLFIGLVDCNNNIEYGQPYPLRGKKIKDPSFY